MSGGGLSNVLGGLREPIRIAIAIAHCVDTVGCCAKGGGGNGWAGNDSGTHTPTYDTDDDDDDDARRQYLIGPAGYHRKK